MSHPFRKVTFLPHKEKVQVPSTALPIPARAESRVGSVREFVTDGQLATLS